MQKQPHSSIPKLALVTVDGIAVQINPASDKSHRQVLHGEYKGKQVTSSATRQMGAVAAKFLRAHGHMVARATETHLG